MVSHKIDGHTHLHLPLQLGLRWYVGQPEWIKTPVPLHGFPMYSEEIKIYTPNPAVLAGKRQKRMTPLVYDMYWKQTVNYENLRRKFVLV